MSLQDIDQRLFQFVNQTATHPWLDALMPFWTDLHRNRIVILPIAAAVLIWTWRKYSARGLVVFVGALAASLFADAVTAHVLKPFFERPRPSASRLGFEVISRGIVYGGPSFPSGHAVGFCCFASFICYFERRLWVIAIPLAALTCYSRVYCGDHFPSDVIAGAAIGTVIGVVLAYLSSVAQRSLQKRTN